ncbi:MAG: signal peptidase I [Ruminiclostridium sp.]|nr:signal peptidase I [Ruminiclostridium sp.]
MAESNKVKEALDWILHIGIAVLIGVLIVTFVAQRTLVHDISMQPTLVEGDNLVVEKLSAKLGGLHKGDIIVFYVPEENRQLIKRLIAVEGDKVEIKNGKVYINDKAVKEDYLRGVETQPLGFPEYDSLIVPKGFVYVLGDNRPNSKDSRSIGPVEASRISGRAIFRFYPFNKAGVLK